MIQKDSGNGSNVLIMKTDVSNREEVRQSAQTCKQRFGDVDILINNAGIVQGKQMMDLNENLVRKQFVVNCESHFWLIREFLGPMIEKNKGHIVSIASAAGLLGQPFMTDYCASKFAAVGMQEALRIELKRARKNITCTTIMPYFINTGMFEGAKGTLLFPFLD